MRQFAGLAVRFVRDCNARVIIRGVRSLSDMEAEFTMTLANRKLDPGIETVFLMADEEYSHYFSLVFPNEADRRRYIDQMITKATPSFGFAARGPVRRGGRPRRR